uniref:EipA family protein n=1 Tax=uncultured Erythrobacter sp. TaxID=263913 RepID=UPI00262FB499|nr:EipA family protein [uncultured Erythrobacter sp.]
MKSTSHSPIWTRFVGAALAAAAMMAAPLSAQGVGTFDPNDVFGAEAGAATSGAAQDTGGIDADLASPQEGSVPSVAPPLEGPQPVPAEGADGAGAETAAPSVFDDEFAGYGDEPTITPPTDETTVIPEADAKTYGEDDLIGAAEGVFGKGAEGLARMIEDLLKDQGEPNGYIVGREAGGAFIIGARYGSGTLHHKVEGERKVYWTGPSIGLDAGANAAKTFVLVYNLFDTEDLYTRYPAGEGQAYLIGGMHASYMRKGDVVLIPIRLGAGVRLGINAGYMKFSKKQRWLPF